MTMNKEQFDAAIQYEQRLDAAIGANRCLGLSTAEVQTLADAGDKDATEFLSLRNRARCIEGIIDAEYREMERAEYEATQAAISTPLGK